jgi:predicted nucleic acid-binding protein
VLLVDNSAWSRLINGLVPSERAQVVASWMEQGEIGTCLPFLMESGYSARSFADHQTLMEGFSRLTRFEITPVVERLALQAQSELARSGHHRLPPTDVLIAACAHEADAGVLHYDRDYDVIVERTGLSFDSVWLAPPGTL